MSRADDAPPSQRRAQPRHDRTGTSPEQVEQDRLRAWSHVTPPPALDRLVRERLERVLEEERQARGEPGGAPMPHHVPHPERWVYALGVVGYGTQLAGGLLRFLWHTFAG